MKVWLVTKEISKYFCLELNELFETGPWLGTIDQEPVRYKQPGIWPKFGVELLQATRAVAKAWGRVELLQVTRGRSQSVGYVELLQKIPKFAQ